MSPASRNQSTYHSWASSYKRQPNYVEFSKTVTYTTIEPNFDERAASDIRHLKVGGYKQKMLQSGVGSMQGKNTGNMRSAVFASSMNKSLDPTPI